MKRFHNTEIACGDNNKRGSKRGGEGLDCGSMDAWRLVGSQGFGKLLIAWLHLDDKGGRALKLRRVRILCEIIIIATLALMFLYHSKNTKWESEIMECFN